MLLAWIDFETTGLDIDEDFVLEAALVVTERTEPWDEKDYYDSVVAPDGDWEKRVAEPVVWEMHTRTGLIDDVKAATKPLHIVEAEMIAVLARHGEPGDFMLSGSGVGHFDDSIIERKMPSLQAWLHWRHLDISSIREGIVSAGRRDLVCSGATFTEDAPAHRALADIRDHLSEYRTYARLIAGLPVAEA